MGRKRKLVAEGESNEVDLPPKHLSSLGEKQQLRLVVILENAQLDTAKVNWTTLISLFSNCIKN